jgi:chromosome segregation ATPase
LKKQTEIVAFKKQCDDIDGDNATQIAHIAVLSKKRDRTRTKFEKIQHDVEELEIYMRKYQREMCNRDIQLSHSVESSKNLVETNIHFEAEILENLRKREIEASGLESQIESIANQREALAEGLI